MANDDERLSFHLNLRKDKKENLHELINFENIKHHLNFSGKRVLDIGCGHGFILSKLKDNNDVFGLDYIKDNPYKIKKKVVDLNSIDCLPFEDTFFDVIICSNILEHITKPALILNEIKRVLKKNGKAIIVVPNEYTFRNKIDFILGKPLVSHQIDSFGHKYIAGVIMWKKFMHEIFDRFDVELYKQREKGKIGKLSDFLSIFFPEINKDQIAFIITK